MSVTRFMRITAITIITIIIKTIETGKRRKEIDGGRRTGRR